MAFVLKKYVNRKFLPLGTCSFPTFSSDVMHTTVIRRKAFVMRFFPLLVAYVRARIDAYRH